MSRSLGIPVKLLHESVGHVVTVELKNEELYRGNMIECEDNWNCQLESITYTAKIFGDPDAADIVFTSGADILAVGINVTHQVVLTGMEMAQLICGGCRTLLMHTRGASSVRCSCCNTINLVRPANQVVHINCGQCHTALMYPYGAPSVKCAVCHYITNTSTMSAPVPLDLMDLLHPWHQLLHRNTLPPRLL